MIMDIGTLYYSSTVSRVSILVIFVVILFSEARSIYIFHWIAALLSSSLGSALSSCHTTEAMFSVPAALVIYPLFFFSLTASWSGLRVFYSKKINYSTLLFFTLFPVLVYCVGLLINLPDRILLSFIYLMAAAVVIMVLYEIYRTPDKKIVSQYVIAFAFSFYLIALLIPAIMILTGFMPARQNSSAIAAMLFDQWASILIYFGYIAMAGERANIALRKIAEIDPLTELINRRGAQRVLEGLYSRTGFADSFSILIGDVDFFKKINDTKGHQAGDLVLQGVAKLIKLNLRKHDEAVRWGGEEFLMILPNTDCNDAKSIAERIRLSIEQSSFQYDNERIQVTISVGVSTAKCSDATYETAISRADINLYDAKKCGRNRVRCDD